MSKNYPFIKRMIESSIAIGPLPLLLLPNFSFDYGYALYQLDQKEEGKQQIKESLKNFPQVLRMLKETGVWNTCFFCLILIDYSLNDFFIN